MRRKPLQKRYYALPTDREFPPNAIWYAMAVGPRREFQVAQWLEENDWFTLVPTCEKWSLKTKGRGGKRQPRIKQIVPELGGFVFAAPLTNPNWLALERCWHLRGPLNVSGVPIPLSGRQVSRFHTEAIAASLRARQKLSLAPGRRARITNGAFSGLELDITKIQGAWAETIQDWFGERRTVKVRIEDLEAA
jgi:transcription antitermination factor NusG